MSGLSYMSLEDWLLFRTGSPAASSCGLQLISNMSEVFVSVLGWVNWSLHQWLPLGKLFFLTKAYRCHCDQVLLLSLLPISAHSVWGGGQARTSLSSFFLMCSLTLSLSLDRTVVHAQKNCRRFQGQELCAILASFSLINHGVYRIRFS